jgi:DNA-binding response OmpR family regulator
MISQLFLEPLMGFFQRRIILIADDNRDLAISLSILLKLVGFEVDIVHNGRDAVAAAKIRRPDVLLLDIGLPGLDGYQVARQFRIDDIY